MDELRGIAEGSHTPFHHVNTKYLQKKNHLFKFNIFVFFPGSPKSQLSHLLAVATVFVGLVSKEP